MKTPIETSISTLFEVKDNTKTQEDKLKEDCQEIIDLTKANMSSIDIIGKEATITQANQFKNSIVAFGPLMRTAIDDLIEAAYTVEGFKNRYAALIQQASRDVASMLENADTELANEADEDEVPTTKRARTYACASPSCSVYNVASKDAMDWKGCDAKQAKGKKCKLARDAWFCSKAACQEVLEAHLKICGKLRKIYSYLFFLKKIILL